MVIGQFESITAMNKYPWIVLSTVRLAARRPSRRPPGGRHQFKYPDARRARLIQLRSPAVQRQLWAPPRNLEPGPKSCRRPVPQCSTYSYTLKSYHTQRLVGSVIKESYQWPCQFRPGKRLTSDQYSIVSNTLPITRISTRTYVHVSEL